MWIGYLAVNLDASIPLTAFTGSNPESCSKLKLNERIGLYATVEILSYRAITKTRRLPEHKLAISQSRDQNLQFGRCRCLSYASIGSKLLMRFAQLLTLHKPFGTQSWMTVAHGCDDS